MTVGRWAIWTPGLAVAIGAAVATAHGLYEVAVAAAVPAVIAWLYPLITDGLALVAYAATARLHARAARYAWSVVVLAAGLSGLAQAAYLAAGPDVTGAPVVAAPPMLRFGIGAWPAVAAAIVAHLLYLLATDAATSAEPDNAGPGALSAAYLDSEAVRGDTVRDGLLSVHGVHSVPGAVQPRTAPGVQSDARLGVQSAPSGPAPSVHAVPAVEQPDRRPGPSPARDRAQAAAARHAARHGHLPTVSELEAAAEVSRGTAAAVLKNLRDHPRPLHLITSAGLPGANDDDPTIEEHTQS